MATMTEAKPLVVGLALAQRENFPFQAFSGSRIVLAISGIGKVNAAMASAWLIHHFHPALICNIGAAGSLGGKGSLGEFYHINRVIEPDRPDLTTGAFMEHSPEWLEGFEFATLATHDRPLRLPEQRMEAAGFADLVDMEGAAVVQTAHRFGCDCYLFKFVSDTPEHADRSAIIENIGRLRDVQMRFFAGEVMPALQKAGKI